MKITDVKSPYLFISYAHKDSDTVLPIIRAMEACGFRLWYDQGIEAGTEWPANIAAHLREASAVVVFMSQNTVASRNCRNEINLALEKNIEVLVVYIEDTELRYGLDLQLGTSQSLFYHRYSTLDGFVSVLQTNLILKSCLASNEISAETAVKTKDAVNTAKTPSPDSSRSKKKATITASDDPVLLIGLGGIGSDAVFTAYEMLFPAYRDKLTAIGIDTDPYPSRAFDSAHIFANLMARDYSEDCQPHLFNILLPNPETLELSTLADKLACDEKRELFAHMNTMQKQQTIPPRRLAYLSFCDQTSLKHSVGKIASELSRLAKSSRTTVNVYLVTTLAGRCGTGILLPTAIYLHSLASDYNIRIHITAVLAQTDIIEPFLSPDSVQIARAGAYATLKELCAYGHPDLPWEAYGPFRHIGDRISPRLLIDSIAFVTKAYVTDSPSERRSALTDTLIAEVSLQDESILLDKNTNSHQSPDNTCRAHTSAVGKLLFPRSAILHRAATLMASDCTPYTALFRTLDQASSEKQQESRRLRMPFILSEEVYDQMLTEVLEQSHSLPIHLICGIYKDTTRAEAPVIRSLLRDLDQMLQNEIIRMGIPEYIIRLKEEAEAITLPKSHIFNASAARKRCHDAFLSHHSYTRMLLTDCYETYTQFKDRAVDMILADFIPSSTEAFADCGIAPLFRSPDASRYAITEDENAYYAPDVSYALLCLFRQELRTRKKNRHTTDIGTLEALLRRNDCQTNARGYYEQCGKDRFLQFDMASTSARTTAIRDLTVLQDDLMYFANTLIDRLTDMLFDQLADGLITRLDSLIRNYRRLFELFPTDRPEMPPLALPPHITSICSQEEIDRIASELYQETVEKAGRIETDEINSIAGGITLSCALNINDKTIRAFPAELVRSLYDACGSYLMRHSERMRSLDKQCVLHALAYLDRNRAPERLRESLARMSPHFFKADKTVLLLPVEDHLFLKNHKTVYNLESPDALQNLVSYPMECQVSPNYPIVPNNLTSLHDPT
ncbi:MAG: TIR domain-containing protein, partial [Clostridia bacterium]|nr:TIR domain-containing protein [Clostridia bacterium]